MPQRQVRELPEDPKDLIKARHDARVSGDHFIYLHSLLASNKLVQIGELLRIFGEGGFTPPSRVKLTDKDNIVDMVKFEKDYLAKQRKSKKS